MKCLTITVDDKTLFSGEVAELQWNETGEMVSVTGRFKAGANLLEQLKQVAAQQKERKQPTIPDGTVAPNDFHNRPTLVRDDE